MHCYWNTKLQKIVSSVYERALFFPQAIINARSTFYKPIAISIYDSTRLPSLKAQHIATNLKSPHRYGWIQIRKDLRWLAQRCIRRILSSKSRPLDTIVVHVFQRTAAVRAIVSPRQWTDEPVLSNSSNSVCTGSDRGMTKEDEKKEEVIGGTPGLVRNTRIRCIQLGIGRSYLATRVASTNSIEHSIRSGNPEPRINSGNSWFATSLNIADATDAQDIAFRAIFFVKRGARREVLASTNKAVNKAEYTPQESNCTRTQRLLVRNARSTVATHDNIQGKNRE